MCAGPLRSRTPDNGIGDPHDGPREVISPMSGRFMKWKPLAVGVDLAVINVVRGRKPLSGLGAEERRLRIEVGREIFGQAQLERSDLLSERSRVFGQSQSRGYHPDLDGPVRGDSDAAHRIQSAHCRRR